MAQKPALTNRIYTSGKRNIPKVRQGGRPPAEPNSPTQLSYWQQGLSTPITADIGLSDEERQGIYNLARRQSQGATNAAASELEQKLGTKGFRAGESGIADTALGQLYSKGAESLGQFGQKAALSEAENRFGQNMELSNANLNRLTAGGQLALGGLETGNQLQAAMAALNARKGGGGGRSERTASGAARAMDLGQQQLAWEKEKYGLMSEEERRQYDANLAWQQEQFGTQTGLTREQQALGFLSNIYGNQATYEQQINAPWYAAVGQI